MFCKHDWKLLSSTTTESQLEHADKLGLRITRGGTTLMLRRKYIQIVKCDKCGKVKKFVEDI